MENSRLFLIALRGNEALLGTLLSVIFVVLLFTSYISGSKMGFVSKALNTFSIIISMIAAKIFGPQVSVYINVSFLNNSTLYSVMDKIDGFIRNINFASGLIGGLDLGAAGNVLSYAFNNVAMIIAYIIVFAVAMVACKVLSKFMTFLDYIPIVSMLNNTLGGVLGVIEVILYFQLGTMILKHVSFLPVLSIIYKSLLSSSVCEYFMKNNYIMFFFSL